MLESKFTEDLEQQPSSGATGDKTRKRRQAQTTTPQLPTGMDLVEDDEDDIYPPVAQTKKLKLGVGYAGDVREDVRGPIISLAYTSHSQPLWLFTDVRSTGSSSCSAGEG